MDIRKFYAIALFICGIASASVSAQTNMPKNAEKAFSEAERLFQSGFYPGALTAYNAMIAEYPNSPYTKDALFKKAVTLYHLKRPIESNILFVDLYKSGYNGLYAGEVPYWIGKIYYDQGEYEQAIPFFADAIALQDEKKVKINAEIHRNALFYISLSFFEIREHIQALPFLEHLIIRPDLGKDFTTAYMLLLISYNEAKEFDNAYKMYMYMQSQLTENPSITLSDSLIRHSKNIAAQALRSLSREDEALLLYLELITAPESDIAVSALQNAYTILDAKGNTAALDDLMSTAETAFAEQPAVLAEFWVRMGIDAYNQGTEQSRKKTEYYLEKLEDIEENNFSEIIPLYRAGLLATAHDASVYLSKKMPASEKYRQWYLLLLAKYAALQEQWQNSLHYSELARVEQNGELKNPEALYWYVFALYNEGKYAEVIAELAPSYGNGMENRTAFIYADSLLKTQRFAEAIPVLEKLLPLYQSDSQSEMQMLAETALISAYMETEKYQKAYALSIRLADTYKTGVTLYMAGLAAMQMGKWAEAESYFTQSLPSLQNDQKLLPFAGYYRAYTQYRQGKFADAYTTYTGFALAYPYHPLSWTASMTAAMAALQQSISTVQTGSDANKTQWLQRAADSAQRAISVTADISQQMQSHILQANILSDMGNYTAAVAVLLPLIEQDTAYTAQILFVIADIYAKQGNVQQASATWQTLMADFPNEGFAEEALFKQSELYFNTNDWTKAAENFLSYKRKFPNGRFIEASLYFLGESFAKTQMIDSAILQWQELLQKYPQSTFRFAVMQGLVQLYRVKGEYQSSLDMAKLFLNEFADQAKKAGIEKEIAELGLLVNGLEEKTAIQLNTFTRSGGVTTEAGRKAGLDLAQLYLASPVNEQKGVAILEDILKYPQDTVHTALASLLLGTYYRESGRYTEAAQVLLKSAEYYAALNDERAAEALYGAVDSFERVGSYADARLLYETMQKNWSQSIWTKRAASLLGDM